MGLMDFFSRRDPTPTQFGEMFIKEMQRGGSTEPMTYDADQDRLLIGASEDKQVINLTNIFREYLSLPKGKRRQHLVDRARLFMKVGDNEVAEDFADARTHLRPKLWVRAALEKTRLQIQVDGGDPSKFDIPEYEVGSHLVASLVYDLPQTMQSVSMDQLRDWGVAYYEAMEIARENLEETPFSYAAIGDGCYAFATGDSYDACRLLLPARMDQLKVDGDLIAMVPNRDSLLVAGSEDPQSLQIMVDLAEKALEEPRPMVPMPLRLDGDDWVDWSPPRGHPLAGRFRDLARRFLFEEYGGQKQLLDTLHEQDGIDIFVASYSVVKKADDNHFSYAVWANGVKTLLPKAEWIMFARDTEGVAAIASWEDVERIVGRYFRPTDYYPARMQVEEFPTDAELAALGKADP